MIQTRELAMAENPQPKDQPIDYGNASLEKFRETLLQQYHSQNVTHAGFVIAVIIGTLTLISRWDSFFGKGQLPLMIFYAIVSLIVGLSFYFVGRLSYWISLSNITLMLKESEFKDYYQKQTEKLPCLCVLQQCAVQMVRDNPKKSWQLLLAKLSTVKLVIAGLFLSVLVYSVLLTISILLHLL